MIKVNQWLKKLPVLKIFLSSIKTKVAIKFLKLVFPAENQLGAERVEKLK